VTGATVLVVEGTVAEVIVRATVADGYVLVGTVVVLAGTRKERSDWS
jgi:hypothetical protein